MNTLTYYLKQGDGEYRPLYEYKIPEQMMVDEAYGRQLCTYFIKEGITYELLSNELYGKDEVLVVEERGANTPYTDEEVFHGKGLFIEIRKEDPVRRDFPKVAVLPVMSHYEAVRYLLKDVLSLPEIGLLERTSAEIDEDRGCYVIYTKTVEKEGES